MFETKASTPHSRGGASKECKSQFVGVDVGVIKVDNLATWIQRD